MSNSYENDYISILLNINKRLRDQVEKLYALLKCKVEIDYSSNDKSRIKSVLSDLEIISSNLSLHMEEQASLIEVIKQIDNKHKELIKQNDLINHQVQSIESLSNDNLLLTNENVELKKNNSLLLSQIETMKNENITIKDEKDLFIINTYGSRFADVFDFEQQNGLYRKCKMSFFLFYIHFCPSCNLAF